MSNVSDITNHLPIRERKCMVTCRECACRHFKAVVYERNKTKVFLECANCEAALPVEREVEGLKAHEWT